jgi:hypothetical protein
MEPPTQGLVLKLSGADEDSWSALVQYVQEAEDGTVTFVQEWFPAERPWPVKSDPNGPSPLADLL